MAPSCNEPKIETAVLSMLCIACARVKGGFQLLDLILPELKSHVIPYKFKSSNWLRANLVKEFFLQMNFPPMRALEFIRDHMTFKLRYNQI